MVKWRSYRSKDFKKLLDITHEVIIEEIELTFYNFLKILDLYIGINKSGEINYIRRNHNIYIPVLRYLKKVDIVDTIFDWSRKVPQEIETLCNLTRNDDKLIRLDVDNKTVYNYLRCTSLPKMLYEEYIKLNNTILELENDLDQKRKKEINLLGL